MCMVTSYPHDGKQVLQLNFFKRGFKINYRWVLNLVKLKTWNIFNKEIQIMFSFLKGYLCSDISGYKLVSTSSYLYNKDPIAYKRWCNWEVLGFGG